MKRLILLGGILTLVVLLGRVEPVAACPLCKEAIENADDESGNDPLREARAWNHSIYLMVSMPYLLLGGLGLMIYREHRKKVQAGQQASAGGRGTGGGEDFSCSRQSIAGTS